ncbi:protein-L-isoaspartate O-methyltransferase [Thamnocephalis sphaerospora]|uniref:Protein-L-isoaspartate O-methyltransferase n=1 Tax=Thamnocephalis sphaerospora TaxID=78915 RepID=A0A4P9XMX8_9FUNG|nr:protein-L-isoaspartate O-methyltransferase [Thamnocephalis sphaerospora]|eukprot:RKP07256.1 protein-L-isoaspartate O-methyltransferase [Thamnocephalis sphaerospora]
MANVDRAHYAPYSPYHDAPKGIGFGATISAPHMHAYALGSLESYLQPGMKALDIGSGSGYLTSCMADMVGETGRVIGVEHVEQLNEHALENIRKDHPEFLDQGRILLVTGDGRLGYPSEGPYDCIHVGAAAAECPSELIAQLKAPGRMFIPVGQHFGQAIVEYDKMEDGTVTKRHVMGVQYVPLTDKASQLAGGI